MSTKAEIQAHINTNLASGGSIPASDHRGVLGTNTDSFLENIYPTPLEDNVTIIPEVQNVVTKSGTDIQFKIATTKTGRKVNINGVFSNVTTDYLSNADVFDITSTEYLQDTFIYYTVGLGNNNLNYDIRLSGNTLTVYELIPPGASVTFSLTYNTIA